MTKKGIFQIAACVCVLLAEVSVQADDNSAMVVAVRGDVMAVSEADSRPLKHGDFTPTRVKITTAERSFTVLRFFDGSKVSLRPESSLIVEKFEYSGGDSDVARLHLLHGTLKTTAGAIIADAPERYTIKAGSSEWILTGQEGKLSVCGDEICERRGVDEIVD
jgi:hypothetical protein